MGRRELVFIAAIGASYATKWLHSPYMTALGVVLMLTAGWWVAKGMADQGRALSSDAVSVLETHAPLEESGLSGKRILKGLLVAFALMGVLGMATIVHWVLGAVVGITLLAGVAFVALLAGKG